MKDFALALCGGGGKGSYQIGVWKALIELDMIKHLKAAAGASVGALNAVLIALGDFETAKKIWYGITPETLLTYSDDSNDGLFTRQGLTDIINRLDLTRLRNSIDVYVNTFDYANYKVVTTKLNGLSKEDIRNLLLASTALPMAYSSVNIGGVDYIDGGVKKSGNVPIEALYQNGYRNIYISALDNKFNILHIPDSIFSNGPVIDVKNQYPDARFTEIVPLEPLGDLIKGTLDFSASGIRCRMIAGYSDTKKILNNEEVYIMKNNYTKINYEIKRKMTELFKSQRELEEFIKTANFGNANIKFATGGGKVWYENIVELYGWKVQQHKLVGLQGHYRILDHNDVRQAWVLDPEDLLSALNDYEAIKTFDK